MSLNASDKPKIISKIESSLTKDQLELIADVLAEYGSKSGYHLECLTHSQRPWQEARGNLAADEKGSRSFSKKDMRDFYWKRLNPHEQRQASKA